jgi:hypothetical protein
VRVFSFPYISLLISSSIGSTRSTRSSTARNDAAQNDLISPPEVGQLQGERGARGRGGVRGRGRGRGRAQGPGRGGRRVCGRIVGFELVTDLQTENECDTTYTFK